MSKSRGNEYTLDDLAARGFSPADFRYYCLTVHYRTPMNFTWEGLAGAARARSRLQRAFSRTGGSAPDDAGTAGEWRRRFREALFDDLNLPRALGVVHEAAGAGLPPRLLQELGAEWDSILGVGLAETAGAQAAKGPSAAQAVPGGKEEEVPPAVAAMARERDSLRRAGRFAEADALRAAIRAAGFDVADGPAGPAEIRKVRPAP